MLEAPYRGKEGDGLIQMLLTDTASISRGRYRGGLESVLRTASEDDGKARPRAVFGRSGAVGMCLWRLNSRIRRPTPPLPALVRREVQRIWGTYRERWDHVKK